MRQAMFRVYQQADGCAAELLYETDDLELAEEYVHDHVECHEPVETDTGVVYNVTRERGSPVMWVD